MLDILAMRAPIDTILEALRQKAVFSSAYFTPAIAEWCLHHGGSNFINAAFFNTMLTKAAQIDNATHTEQFLLLGGVWRVEHFHAALANKDLTVCKWAHARGDLKIDFANLDKHVLKLSKESLMWLASIKVTLGKGMVCCFVARLNFCEEATQGVQICGLYDLGILLVFSSNFFCFFLLFFVCFFF